MSQFTVDISQHFLLCSKHNLWTTASRMVEVQDFSGMSTIGKRWVAIRETCPFCEQEQRLSPKGLEGTSK